MSAPGRAERLLQDAAPTSAEIHELVAPRLDEVETLFRENLASPVRIVREIGSFLAEGGGKRVRPTWSATRDPTTCCWVRSSSTSTRRR